MSNPENFDIYSIFDSHFHIIDKRFPLLTNNGFLPDEFTCNAYLERTKSFKLIGGAVISASFQGFDQTYLKDALHKLGPDFVGVTQLPASVSDEEIIELDVIGVRAIRFNVVRGGSESIDHLETLAKRINDIAGWHVELYIDSSGLSDLFDIISRLPSVSIDHLGLSEKGFRVLLGLVERGVRVKATGFGRVDFDIAHAIKEICQANPDSLMFGTDLPSTRAPRPFCKEDLLLVAESLDEELLQKVLYKNAISFSRPLGIRDLKDGDWEIIKDKN
ncbi:MAG: amidohydrolase family protein [Thermodesulfobacteriota bacterium]